MHSTDFFYQQDTISSCLIKNTCKTLLARMSREFGILGLEVVSDGMLFLCPGLQR